MGHRKGSKRLSASGAHRLLDDYDAIVDACCAAWNRLTPERLRSLCNYSYIQEDNC